ncbi:MAG: adenylate/guanylate cyclase domain-containing protein, partial [Chthoniobacterales bacterium]
FRGEFDQAQLKTAELARHAERRQDPALLACSRMLKEAIGIERAEIDPVEMEAFRKDRIAQQPTISIGLRASLALLYIGLGRRAEARAELEFLAADDFSQVPRDWNWLAVFCAVAAVCVALRDLPRARKVYDLLSPYRLRNITVGWGDLSYGCSNRLLGMLATALGNFDEAEVHFDQAIQFDQLAGATPWVAYAKFELARMLLKRGDPSDLNRAVEIAGQVRDTAKSLHMNLLEMRVTALIAKTDLPVTATGRRASANDSDTVRPRRQRVIASIMFVDIVGSTERVAALSDRRWVDVRAKFFELLREQLHKFLGREIDTAGDSMLALFDRPASAIRAAFAISSGAQSLALQVRAGIHFGEVELVDGDVAGIAVHIGARAAAFASASEVIVSSTVRDMMAGGDIKFVDRGTHVLKGVPGEWRLYAVESNPPV